MCWPAFGLISRDLGRRRGDGPQSAPKRPITAEITDGASFTAAAAITTKRKPIFRLLRSVYKMRSLSNAKSRIFSDMAGDRLRKIRALAIARKLKNEDLQEELYKDILDAEDRPPLRGRKRE